MSLVSGTISFKDKKTTHSLDSDASANALNIDLTSTQHENSLDDLDENDIEAYATSLSTLLVSKKYETRPAGRFNHWMGEILDAIILQAHSTWASFKRDKDALNLTPIHTVASAMIAKTTLSKRNQACMSNLLLSLIHPKVKEQYGTRIWTFETAKPVAEEEVDLFAICVYCYHSAAPEGVQESENMDESQDMQESEDFYVGQTLETYDGRTSKHDTLFKNDVTGISRWCPKATRRVEFLPKRAIGLANGGPLSLRQRCCGSQTRHHYFDTDDHGGLSLQEQTLDLTMADVAPFANDRNLASLFGTILEAAGCSYCRSHRVNNHDNLTARGFGHATRPSEIFEPDSKSLNHAFSLRQMLSQNFWRQTELELLQTPASGLIGLKIDIHIQQKLAKVGFDRTAGSDSRTLAWRRTLQFHPTITMRRGMEGLVAFYELELFLTFTEAQIRQILTNLFDSAPLIHSQAMWAKYTFAADLPGIWRLAPTNRQEESRRATYRQGLRYRFVEAAMLAWNYTLNVNPVLVETLKKKMFIKWMKMREEDPAYRAIIAANLDLNDIPVHDSTDQTANEDVSAFKLLVSRTGRVFG